VNLTVVTPTITSVTPTSGVAGTQVTIAGSGFGASQGNGNVWLGSNFGVVVSWGDAQVVATVAPGSQTGTAAILQGGVWSNSVNLTVVTPTITSVTPTSGAAGTQVTIAGSGFGATQGSGNVWLGSNFGLVVSWSDAQVVATVASGSQTGTATILQGGVWSNSVAFTVTAQGTEPLFVTPNQVSLPVGGTQAMQALDQNGVALASVTWSVDNTAVAQINLPQNQGDPTLLQANSPGTANLVVTSGNLSGTAKVTVYTGTGFPVGTIQWSVPSLTPGMSYFSKMVQALRVDANTPDFYFNDGGTFIRALTSDGQQKRVWPAPGVGRYPYLLAGDNQGGALYFANNDTENQFQSICYVGRLDQTGNETWQYQETNCYEDYAIGPDGTIFLMEDSFQNTNWSQVTALDPNTGQIKFGIRLPAANSGQFLGLNFSYVVGNNVSANPPYCTPGTSASVYSMPGSPYGAPTPLPAAHGGLSVSSDGTVYLPFITGGGGTLDAGACNQGPDPTNPYTIDPTQATQTSTSNLQVLAIQPAGSSSIQQVDGASSSFINWYQPQITSAPPRFSYAERAIPDGNGGVFLPSGYALYHGSGSGFSYSALPIAVSHCVDYAFYVCDPLLLGDDGTAYLAGVSASSPNGATDTATAIDPISGSPKWTWQSPGVSLNAVTADGSLAVQVGHALQLIDATGQASPALSTTPAGNDVNYYANGNWSTILSDGSLGLVTGDVQRIAASEHPTLNGNPQKQRLPRLPQVVTFLPSHLGASPNPSYDVPNFYTQMQNTVSGINIVNGVNVTANPPGSAKAIQQFHDGNNARVQMFQSEMNRPVDALAYIGHSIAANPGTAYEFSFGITFYYPIANPPLADPNAPWDILYPNGDTLPFEPVWQDRKLVSMEEDVNTLTGLSSDPNWQYFNSAWTQGHPSLLLVNKVAPQAKIMFFGACSVNPGFGFPGEVPPFVQMWDVHDLSIDGTVENRVRAMIVPVYPPNHGHPDDVDLGVASREWIFILNQLVKGATVADAVNSANNQIQNDPVYQKYDQGLYWMVLGNRGVVIKEYK
jgi:IPT/TIG domain-containing protein/Big-like domain-containing protein